MLQGTGSEKNKDFILGLGASKFIDYEKERFEDLLHDMDFVLDSIGNEYTTRSFKVLKKGGKIICMPSGTSENIAEEAARLGLIRRPFQGSVG